MCKPALIIRRYQCKFIGMLPHVIQTNACALEISRKLISPSRFVDLLLFNMFHVVRQMHYCTCTDHANIPYEKKTTNIQMSVRMQ
jgi:hypothetical protein